MLNGCSLHVPTLNLFSVPSPCTVILLLNLKKSCRCISVCNDKHGMKCHYLCLLSNVPVFTNNYLRTIVKENYSLFNKKINQALSLFSSSHIKLQKNVPKVFTLSLIVLSTCNIRNEQFK